MFEKPNWFDWIEIASQKSIIYQNRYIGLNHGFEREIKRAMSPLGVLRLRSFLNVHLNPRKTLNHHPLQNQPVAGALARSREAGFES